MVSSEEALVSTSSTGRVLLVILLLTVALALGACLGRSSAPSSRLQPVTVTQTVTASPTAIPSTGSIAPAPEASSSPAMPSRAFGETLGMFTRQVVDAIGQGARNFARGFQEGP